MEQVFIHPFENTIGPGPYRFVGTYDMGAALAHQASFGDTAAAFRDAPRLEAGMGSCAHCGHPILNICIVRRGDGKLYGVGTDCILKTDDGKLVDAVKVEKNRLAREKRAAKREAARLARLQQQRENNGGMTDWELAEHRRALADAAEQERLKPIKAALEPYSALIEDGKGGFCDSVARDLRDGHVPRGRGRDIMLDIIAKQEGRANSKKFIARRDELETELKRVESLSEAQGQS